MSNEALELAQERRATRRERTAIRRAERNGKRAELAVGDRAYRATLAGGAL